MQNEIEVVNKTDSELSIKLGLPEILLEDYSTVLDRYAIKYNTSDLYCEVGELDWVQGWIIDISVIPVQFESLLKTIIPLLRLRKLPFKVAKDAGVARSIVGGNLGLSLLGKFVTIYPHNTEEALKIAIQLIEITKQFKGPEILTDRRLHNVVYTRYGVCKGVIQINELGIEEKWMYNSKGDLIRDSYSIPFNLPNDVEWPFSEIVPVEVPKKEKLLQEKYRPMFILKEDAKGSVKKGLYLERHWRIRWCVIKEGRQGMVGDSKGRDITDRLRWQYDLQKELADSVPLPKIYDIFEENGDTYIVMEFIKGKPLQSSILSLLKGRIWDQLLLKDRLNILNYCMEVLDILEKMHKKGYIHRDITPANFLVNRAGKIWMIDLELAYSSRMKKPKWPFRLGTPGFMSPEQEETLIPTVEQDYFSIGALFIFVFTGLMPRKFAQKDPNILKEQLEFFINDRSIIELIAACMKRDSNERPSILVLKEGILNLLKTQHEINDSTKAIFKSTSSDTKYLQNIIQNSLDGLSDPIFLNTDGLWVSQSAKEDELRYDHNQSLSVYPEFFQGLSGIIWVLARAHKSGFSIAGCQTQFDRSLKYLEEKIQPKSAILPGGLYYGTAGFALALIEVIENKLILDQATSLELISANLHNEKVREFGIATGLAGQGMVLLKRLSIEDDERTRSLLERNVSLLLNLQEKDGSWSTIIDADQKKIKFTGFGTGAAGIAFFLMSYIQRCNDDLMIRQAIVKALNWLSKMSYSKKGRKVWPIHSGTNLASFGFQEGGVGIVLTMIKAYEIFEDYKFRDLAESFLRGNSPYPISANLSQANGLAGLGEVYLEAEKVFKKDEWKKRGSWLADFILHHFYKQKNGSCYWMPDETPFTTAGLMEGNSGIIHFLLRYYQPESINHPLLLL